MEEIQNGIFPLWNPYYFNGHPLFATLQPGVLYPFSLIFLILPFDWAFNLNIELHFALSGIFTYFLVRGMGASQGAAVISGAGFMFSGYLISIHDLLSTLQSVTWVPLFFLTFFASIKKNNFGYAILSGVVGTFMFLGGGVEVCYLTFGVTFFLTLLPELVLDEGVLPNLKRRGVLFFSFCITFFGLSAVQLLPFVELTQLSIRADGLSYHEAGVWSLHPYDLIEFFLPDIYGFAADLKSYWKYQNWLKTIYMGGMPFILAVLFFSKWNQRALGFLFLFILSLGLAMGNNTLFHHFLYDYLPFFNKLRFPVKFIFLAILILSVVAGLGYDIFKRNILEPNPEKKRWTLYILIVGFCCMIAFGAVNIFNGPIIAYFKGIGWDKPNYSEIEITIFNFKRFLGFTSLFCLGLYLYPKPKFKNTYFLAVIISLFILDLFFANFNFYKKGNYIELQEVGKNAKFILSDPEIFRVYLTPKTAKASILSRKEWSEFRALKEKLALGLLNNQRIFDVNGIAVTKLERWKIFMDFIVKEPAIDSTNLLNMMNVKYAISTVHILAREYELVNSYVPIQTNKEERIKIEKYPVVKVYENKNFLERAYLVPQCKVLKSEEEYNENLKSKSFDPRKILFLDKEPTNFACRENKVLENMESVEINSYKSNSIELSTQSKERRLLFMSDTYYPGWKAYIDGKEVEILRANYLFRAIVLEAGKHQIRFKYDPLSFKLGLAITFLTTLVCLIYFFKSKLARSRRVTSSIPT